MKKIIDSHDKNEPLFLLYSAQNPHVDDSGEVPEEFENMYKDVEPEKRRKILSMITLLDYSIMNVTESLKSNGMLENTIIVFTSDVGFEKYLFRFSKTTNLSINSRMVVEFSIFIVTFHYEVAKRLFSKADKGLERS